MNILDKTKQQWMPTYGASWFCNISLHAYDVWQEPEVKYEYQTILLAIPSETKRPVFYQRRHCIRCMRLQTRRIK